MPAQQHLSVRRRLVRILLVLVIVGSGIAQPVTAFAAPTAAAPSAPTLDDDPIEGIPLQGSTGITESTAQIIARQAIADTLPMPPPPPDVIDDVDFSGKINNPASLRLHQGPGAVAPAAGLLAVQAGTAPQTIGVSADGPNSTVNTCGTPPDTMGAVGPTQFVITINCNFVSYNKTTGVADGFLNARPDVFFNSVRGGASVSDPHVRYDPTSGRWFIVMITVALPSSVMLAVSSGPNITATSSWTFFSFNNTLAGRTNCLGDYPTPGIDVNAIYIGVNQFCGAALTSVSFLSSDGYVVQKSSLLGAGPVNVTAFPNLFTNTVGAAGPYTPQGVDNPDTAATEGYFIGVDGGSWGLLQLRRVSHPGNDPAGLNPPTISGNVSITTALQNSPLATPHLGNTAQLLDASDGRLFQAYFRNGSLWTALDSSADATCSTNPLAANNDRNAVYWYEITGIPSGQTPAVAQAGSVCDPSATNPAFYTYGSIMVNGLRQAVVGFTIAGATNFTTPGFAGRLAGDTASSLEGVNILTPGTHPYNPAFDTNRGAVRRWGDYSYTSLDPCDDMTLWTIQEYASSDNVYGERFAQLKAPPPAAPGSALPPAMPVGLSNQNVTLTGVSSAGSAFYDTPATITDACRTRLKASASGGVTVNSVTYTDATHITLNISTLSATPGPINVTVTNPDGQSVTANGILSVTSNSTTADSTQVSSSINPSTFNTPVKFTATVTPVSGSVVPTGSITFMDGPGSLGTVALAAGSASLTISTLTVGTHTITANYSGDANYASSSGALVTSQVVNKDTAGVTLGSLAQIYNGTGRSATATTTPPNLGVSFTYNGSSTLPIDSGSYPVVATVNDSSYTGTASGNLVISRASTSVQILSSKNPALIGTPINFTISLSSLAPSSGLIVDGTVTLTVDGVPQTLTLNSAGAVTSGAFTGLGPGPHAVSATYTGSLNFNASGPANLSQVMRLGTFLPMVIK